MVAREFRSGDASNEQIFSPASRKWIIHLFLVLASVQQLSVLVMDVKDAYLTVPQKDLEHFESTVSQFGFVLFEGMVTVYKHKTKCMSVTINVDDLLVIGSNDDCNWFKTGLSKTFTVKCEGPCTVDDKWECQYLKRTIVCTEAGILPKLLELLKVENRRGKSVPHHAQLEIYLADRVLDAERLVDAESKLFRGGLGICFYIAQDRPDIQEGVKTLSGYMGCPTIKAMSALKAFGHIS